MNPHIDSQLPHLALTRPTRLSRLKNRRKLWLKIHLWLGLSAGAMLLVVGLTGSILVFWQELDGQLNPDMHQVQAAPEGRQAYRPLQELVLAADRAMPGPAKRSTIYYPRDEGLAFWFFYEVPTKNTENHTEESDSWNVFVNPYTAQVTGVRLWASANNVFDNGLISFIFQLHYSVLLSWDSGSWIVGVIGILAFISVLTGLIVWWPLTGKWRQALVIKRRASSGRFNYDLHKTSGIYLFIVLLAVLVSGVYFNFGEQFRWLIDQFSLTTPLDKFQSTPLPGMAPVTLDEAIARSNVAYPEGRLYWFTVPDSRTGVYTLTQHIDFGWIFNGRRQIVLDQYSGDILYVADPLAGRAGNVFIQWQWPLHSGQALRMPGRIMVLLSGIGCAVLFGTGVIRWLQKRQAQHRSDKAKIEVARILHKRMDVQKHFGDF